MPTADIGLQWPAISRLSPLSRLSPESLREVQRVAHVGELEPGQDLFRKGSSDAFDYFLVDGTVELHGEPSGPRSVSGGTAGALAPLSCERPRPVTARARTRIRFLRLQAGLLDMLSDCANDGGYTVREFRPDDEDPQSRLLFEIYNAYAEDRLVVPAVPELAERIRRAVDDVGNGAPQIARVVQADPAVAARLVRVANSALYAGNSPVRNLREAVVRLGLQATRDLVVAFTLQNLFESVHGELRRRLLDVWRQSTYVAAVSHALARRIRGWDPDRAMLGGLLHDIGAAVLITHAEHWPELISDPAQLERVIGALGGEVGSLALSRWGFQDDLVTVAREARSWMRDPGGAPDLCDVILLARLYGLRTGAGAPPDLPALESVPAYARLGLASLPAGEVSGMLEEAQKEIGELRRLLVS